MRASRAGSFKSAVISERQSFGREVALFDPDRAAAFRENAGVFELILIQSMRQGHQNSRTADGGKLGDC